MQYSIQKVLAGRTKTVHVPMFGPCWPSLSNSLVDWTTLHE